MRAVVSPTGLILVGLSLVSCLDLAAGKLPFRHFTTEEGLAGDTVHSIVQDSRGLLWFCTNDGLSRFDGREFVTFGSGNGLGDQEVLHILEGADGTYWAATARGISRMESRGASTASLSFTNFFPGEERSSQWIHRLVEDDSGGIWIGTNAGLYHMSATAGRPPVFQHVPLRAPTQPEPSPRILALAKDRYGRIWAGGDRGLFQLYGDGRSERYSTADGLPANFVLALDPGDDGVLWVGLNRAFCRVTPQSTGRAVVDRVYTIGDGLPDAYVSAILPSAPWLWVGTANGLARLPLAGGDDVQVFGAENGPRNANVEALLKDRQGNIWTGTRGGGASRLAGDGFTTYRAGDGLASVEITGIVEETAGRLYAVSTRGSYELALNLFDGNGFVKIQPRFPSGVTQFGWGWAQTVVRDQSGEWWIAASQGVVRYPNAMGSELGRTKSIGLFETGRELPRGTVFRIFADSHGGLWISTTGYAAHGLARWERASGRWKRFRPEDGLPTPAADDCSLASAFAEDHSGTVWIGFHRGGLVRFRGGRLVPVHSHVGGVLEGVRWIHPDGRGRLWIAGRKGLLRVDDPHAERPAFRHYGEAAGLASNFVMSIAEDRAGRIYIGSGRGVDRLDPDTGQIRHYGLADGLVSGEIRVAHRDQEGNLWFASAEGISRYSPRQDQLAPAPKVYISQVRLGSYDHELDQNGQEQISVRPMSWRHNTVHVGFMGVGDALRYQYRLEGVDADWSPPTETRSVTYPALGAGSYRFLVRAINAEGTASSRPAIVLFRIEPRFWATWWFRSAAAGASFAALFLFHRMRLAKAVALERIRRRIAQDLHDDVGASLCQAALLSDLVRREKFVPNTTAGERLEQISAICRQVLDSMGDIVWAIDPEKDPASDLIQRMRTFGEEMLVSRDVDFRFSAAGASDQLLDPHVRHEVFLVFKEAIHNVVRHSGANLVEAELGVTGSGMTLRIADDGRGFYSDPGANGHGLRSMRQRVLALGGSMQVQAREGGGTCLEFAIPMRRSR